MSLGENETSPLDFKKLVFTWSKFLHSLDTVHFNQEVSKRVQRRWEYEEEEDEERKPQPRNWASSSSSSYRKRERKKMPWHRRERSEEGGREK